MHNNKPLSAVGAEQHQWSVPRCVMNCAFKIGWKKKSIFSERWINQYPSKVVPRLKRRTGFSFINQQTASHQIWLAHRASMKSRLNAVGQSGHGAVLNLELGAHVSGRPQLFFFPPHHANKCSCTFIQSDSWHCTLCHRVMTVMDGWTWRKNETPHQGGALGEINTRWLMASYL